MPVGNCAGMLVVPGQHVTVHVGQQIDVHMTEEGTGPHGSRMVPAIPLPHSSSPAVLIPGAISPDRATGTYRAARPGHAALTSPRTFCLITGQRRASHEIVGNCPVIEVTVVR